MLTHVNPIIELVVNNLQQTNDMQMTAFFHYRNLFPNFMFETSELFCEWRMGRSGEIPLAKHVHFLSAWINAFDSLYGLIKESFWIALESKIRSEKEAL